MCAEQARLSDKNRDNCVTTFVEEIVLLCGKCCAHFMITLLPTFNEEVIMFGLFKKREEVFHNLMVQQAEITYHGLQLLEKYLADPKSKLSEQLSIKESEADEVRRILIDELNRTFITPYDR